MKILLLIMLSLSVYATDILDKEADKNFTREEIVEMNKLYTITTAEKSLNDLQKVFIKDTGDKNYKKYLVEAIQDEDWRKGNYAFLNKKKKDSYVIYDNQKIKANTPEYELALDYFLISAQKGNILSAYQGYKILEKYFMMFGANKITKKYLQTFAFELMKKDYCIGFLAYSRTFGKGYETEADVEKIKQILDEGEKRCKNPDIPNFYLKGLQHEKAMNNTILKIRKAKEAGQ